MVCGRVNECVVVVIISLGDYQCGTEEVVIAEVGSMSMCLFLRFREACMNGVVLCLFLLLMTKV